MLLFPRQLIISYAYSYAYQILSSDTFALNFGSNWLSVIQDYCDAILHCQFLFQKRKYIEMKASTRQVMLTTSNTQPFTVVFHLRKI